MPITDSAWLDAQYDARAASPDHPSILARWSEASSRARARLRCEIDLRYGPAPLQTADWFPAASPGAPVFVFVHGGYWRGSDKSVYSFVAPELVRAGATVVLPNYDLCPTVTIETIVREIRAATDWIAARAPDASRIVVSGHSAGGHLAACIVGQTHAQRAADPRCASGLGISGLYDLEPIRHVPFLAPDLRLEAATAERLSPARQPPRPGTVFHAFVGADESEEFHRQSTMLARRWGETAVPVCEALAGRRHFDILDDLADPDGRLFASACGLLFSPSSPRPGERRS